MVVLATFQGNGGEQAIHYEQACPLELCYLGEFYLDVIILEVSKGNLMKRKRPTDGRY